MRYRKAEELAKLISKDDLELYYKSHNRAVCVEHFNINECEFRKLIKYYNIVKSQEDIVNTSKQTRLERYGVEHHMKVKDIALEAASHKDYSKVIEKSKQTCLERYGVDSFSKTDEFKEAQSKRLTEYNLTKKDYKKLSEDAKGKKMMFKDGEQTWVYLPKQEQYLKDGWQFGSCKKRKKKRKKNISSE